MEWVERTDRTVEAAKDFLLDQLGVDEDEAEFEVLEEPKPGLFGRVRGQARVRARVAPQTPRAKEDRNRRRARPKTADRGPSTPKEKAPRPAAEKPSAPAAQAEAEPRAPRPPRQPAGVSGGNGGSQRQSPAADRPPADPAAIAPAITTFLDELAQAFGVTATASVTVTDEGELEATLDGDNLGSLIGPRGDVIGAIQELARTVAQKESHGGQAPRLRVDVGGYRAERRISLAAFTQQTAQQVLESGKAHALEPMGSVDRKIVHDAAGEVEGVETRSDGEEPARRVVIVPA
jgi:spoIIIJ-associated protein